MDKPRCAVKGMVFPPLGMCGHIIVGMEFCGTEFPCQHKIKPFISTELKQPPEPVFVQDDNEGD